VPTFSSCKELFFYRARRDVFLFDPLLLPCDVCLNPYEGTNARSSQFLSRGANMKRLLRRLLILVAPIVWRKVSPIVRRKLQERRRGGRPVAKRRYTGWRH
jgi:hypothetical protein